MVDPDKARKILEAQGCTVVVCMRADDRYLDFSMYHLACRQFIDDGVEDAVFVNDTLMSKHDSRFLLESFAKCTLRAREGSHAFPVMIGPHSRSEFSYGDGRNDEFVSTYLFYLNRSALVGFSVLLGSSDAVLRGLKSGAAEEGIESGLIRMCLTYKPIVVERYTDSSEWEGLVHRKLVTVYWERALSGFVRRDGVVWYVGSGLVGRLLIPIQVAISKWRSSMRRSAR
jgi:hypothetical protein